MEVDDDGFVAKIGGKPLDLEVIDSYINQKLCYIIKCTIESLQGGIFH